MSCMRYISFPMELTKHQVSYIKLDDEDGFRIDTAAEEDWYNDLPVIEGRIDGRFSIWDIIGCVIFNNCFKNPFVYEFYAEVPDYFYEQQMEIMRRHREKEAIDGFMDDEAKEQELSQYWNKEWSLQNQVLYKYLQDNLNTGEFVEIYESWIDGDMVFDPPTSETVINLKELLSLPFSEGPDDLGERTKLTIHKT